MAPKTANTAFSDSTVVLMSKFPTNICTAISATFPSAKDQLTVLIKMSTTQKSELDFCSSLPPATVVGL